MMRAAVVLMVACSLSGCASLWWAGASEYEISPLLDKNGAVTGCCSLTVHSGKQYATINATFTKTGNDYNITLNETQIEAFKGQQISATAASDVAASATTAAVNALKSIK